MSDFATVAARLTARRRIRLAAVLGALAVAGNTAQAQTGNGAVPSISQPVVQSVPGATGMKLNEVLHRLARNPTDVPTLLEAGKVSMQIGDPAAAVGFYQRAAKLAPANPNVQAGLAGAYALNDDPLTAITLFQQAERAGPIDPALLAPRGLAYDLVGDNATAQTYYKQALAAGSDDETVRRLALSQAISGDRRAMEVTLTPLLQKQDKGAWRTRAFALAILGQGAEAESIVRSTMPAQLAEPMSAYLRYMPRLTASQQAAAANLGQFPRAADIGREDPRFAAFQRPRSVLAAAVPPPAAAAVRPGTKEPTKGSRKAREAAARREAAAAAPTVRVAAAPTPAAAAPVAPLATRETTATPTVTTAPAPKPAAPKPVELPPVQAAAAPPPSAPAPRPAATLAAATPVTATPATGPVMASASAASTPGFASLDTSSPAVRSFDLKPASSTAAPVQPATPASTPAPTPVAATPPATPAPVPAATPAPAARPRLADLFADLAPPNRAAEPVAGAVDVRRIAPAVDLKAKAAAEAKAKAEREAKAAKDAEAREKAIKASAAAKHPSRVWVQVATGRDKSALGFDWRRFNRENPDVFGKRSPFVTAWGQTNRLLTGPFPSDKAASAFIAQMKKAGIDGAFSWTSPAGQVVDALGSGK